MTPAEIGYETLDPNSEMSVAPMPMRGMPAPSRTSTTPAGLLYVRSLSVATTPSSTICRAQSTSPLASPLLSHTSAWSLAPARPDAAALVERGDRREQRVLHLGVGREWAGERRDHADLHHWSGAAPRLGGRGDRAARDRHHGREDAEHEERACAMSNDRPCRAPRTPTRAFAPMVPPTVMTARAVTDRFRAHPTICSLDMSKMQKIEQVLILSPALLSRRPVGDNPLATGRRRRATWSVRATERRRDGG